MSGDTEDCEKKKAPTRYSVAWAMATEYCDHRVEAAGLIHDALKSEWERAVEECMRAAKKCRAEIDYYDPPSADRICEEIIEAIEKMRTTTERDK